MSEVPGTMCKVLIADSDAFEGDYVADTLRRTGVQVAGPLHTRDEVLSVLDRTPVPEVVVLGAQLRDGASSEVLDELRRRGIRHMVLIGAREDHALGDLTATPVLAKPFAAYQVADWVRDTIGEPAHPAIAPGTDTAA